MSDALKQTPLFHAHKELGARMAGFAGWEMPLSYAGQIAEHQAVRTRAGMFDVSHMGQVRFRGEGALALLQLLVPGNMAKLEDGQAKYTQLCNDHGGIIDDLIVSRIGEEEYFAVVNAARREGDVDWMQTKARILGFGSVEIVDESERWSMIAVQGPEALKILDQVVGNGKWTETVPFTLHPFMHHGELHLLSRTGYTGEPGAELLCPPDQADYWWSELLEAGVVPCGLAARDSLRLEAGYCLYGTDIDESVSPVEARLSWSIGWEKEEKFIGRTVLEKQKAEKPKRRLMGFQTETRKPLRHGDAVILGGQAVGEITSGGFSPVLNVGIALGYIRADLWKEPEAGIKTRSGVIPARIVRPPFVKTELSK